MRALKKSENVEMSKNFNKGTMCRAPAKDKFITQRIC